MRRMAHSGEGTRDGNSIVTTANMAVLNKVGVPWTKDKEFGTQNSTTEEKIEDLALDAAQKLVP